MSSVNVDLWSCPSCEVTETLEGTTEQINVARYLVQQGHAARHRAERARVGPIASALLDVTEAIDAFRIRLVVAPADLERIRSLVIRRQLPVEVYADDELATGEGYMIQPRKGVRELPGSEQRVPRSTRQDDAS